MQALVKIIKQALTTDNLLNNSNHTIPSYSAKKDPLLSANEVVLGFLGPGRPAEVWGSTAGQKQSKNLPLGRSPARIQPGRQIYGPEAVLSNRE